MSNSTIQILFNGRIHNISPNESFTEEDIEKKIEWIIKSFNRVPINVNGVEWIWCLVGNIVEEHPWGENHLIKGGTKHFPPGAKVYCFPPLWGDGYEKIQVIGKPRKQNRLISVVIKSDLVTNWRISRVYDSFIILEMLTDWGWDNSEESKARIEELIKGIIESRSKK